MVEEQRARPERRAPAEDETGPIAPPPRVAVAPSQALRCPYCHGELAKDLLVARCELCRTAHHATCFGERGACSVHGCRGRAAHVGTISGRVERLPFAPCRGCQTTIFLDEPAALCRKCDSPHHPSCLETRGSCARCGTRDATLMAATEFQRLLDEEKRIHARSSMPAIATGGVLLAAAAAALVWGSVEISVLLLVCAVAEFALGAYVYLRAPRLGTIVSPGAREAPGAPRG